jgi:hypothetical protein
MRLTVALASFLLGCGRVGFALCVGCDGGEGTVQVVQTAGPGSVLGPEIPIAIDQTADDFVVIAAYRIGDNPLAITDSLGESYASLPSERSNGACFNSTFIADIQLWYAHLGHTGTNTITVHQDGPGSIRRIGAFVIEYSGIATTRTVDVASGQVPTSTSNAMTAGTLATTGPGVIVAVFADTSAPGTMVPDPDSQVLAHDDSFASSVQDRVIAGGAYTPTATLPAGDLSMCWVGASAAFRAR